MEKMYKLKIQFSFTRKVSKMFVKKSHEKMPMDAVNYISKKD